MTLETNATEDILPLWQLVPPADYALPAAPARDAAAKGFSALQRLFRAKHSDQQPPKKTEDQLSTFTEAELSRLAPAIDWRDAATPLEGALQAWPPQKAQDPAVWFFIGPPYGGHADILRSWAQIRRLPVIEAPSREQILAGDNNWLSALPDNQQPWMLPELERCYLRHVDGLAVVRNFFERAFSGGLGFGLVGCDSWAWAYLQKVGLFQHTETLALQAFDGERLKIYLRGLAVSSALGPLRFRDSDTGEEILQTENTDRQEPSSASPFLKRLAAHSRGILGVAQAMWRNNLRSEPDEAFQAEAPAGTTLPHVPRNTIWLKSRLPEPVIPDGPIPDIAFVLHCLLLHSSLPFEFLPELLPLSRNALATALHMLATAGIVEEHNNAWRVSVPGYPVVRQFLKNNGYLVDAF